MRDRSPLVVGHRQRVTSAPFLAEEQADRDDQQRHPDHRAPEQDAGLAVCRRFGEVDRVEQKPLHPSTVSADRGHGQAGPRWTWPPRLPRTALDLAAPLPCVTMTGRLTAAHRGWRYGPAVGRRPDAEARPAEARTAQPVPDWSSDHLSRRGLFGAVAVAGLASLGGDRRPVAYPGGLLRIATGNRGGVYFAYGRGVAAVVRRELPHLQPAVLVTDASVQNLHLVTSGGADVAFSLADSAAAAYRGQPPFQARLPVTALARLYDNYMHLVVRAGDTVRTVADLRGRAVAIGGARSGTEFLTCRILAAAGIDVERDIVARRLELDPATVALAADQVSALFFSGGIPVGAIASLAARVPIRLIDLTGCIDAMRSRYGDFYTERTVPASAYQLPGAVGTVGVPNYFVVAAGMDVRLAHELTRALFAGRDLLVAAHPAGRRLDVGAAIATYPLPLHPGAVRYYREAKR